MHRFVRRDQKMGWLMLAGCIALTCGALASGARAQGHSTSITGNKPRVSTVTEPEFPDDWYIRGKERPRQYRNMERKPAPPLSVSDWHGTALDLDSLKGQIVVVDFWATWCGPCKQALPKNVKLAEAYRDRGVVFIGMHDSRRGWESVPQIAERYELNYALGKADTQAIRNWKIAFWPTYAVIDRRGVVRAAGLIPSRVETVLGTLLAEEQAEASSPVVAPTVVSPGAVTDEKPGAAALDPKSFEEGSPQDRRRLADLIAMEAPPAVESTTWLNLEALRLEDPDAVGLEALRGKVVLLDFWATWCGPCIASVPKLNALQKKYGDQGLVIVGICHTRGVERMQSVVESSNITYAVCADDSGTMNRNYRVNGYPDYYLIDRAGTLRVADCSNRLIEDAIKVLLEEDTPKPAAASAIE